MTKLLLGLYRPTEGAITADGIDLHIIAPQSWRAQWGAVLQDFMRYELTVRENIGFGALARLGDLAAIEQAAQLSSTATFVAHLSARYETILGRQFEGGQDLSTGQWQKLALARAYLRDALVVVLDEPTAALDARTEVNIYRRFHDLVRGQSALLSTHRRGAARLAARILFLASGQVVEAGTQAELCSRFVAVMRRCTRFKPAGIDNAHKLCGKKKPAFLWRICASKCLRRRQALMFAFVGRTS